MNPPVSRRVGFFVPEEPARLSDESALSRRALPKRTDHEIRNRGLASGAGIVRFDGGRGAGECGDAGTRREYAVQADAGADIRSALASRFSARWPDVDHRKGRADLAVHAAGQKLAGRQGPKVAYGGQGGMLGIFLSPHYASDHN